MSQVRGGMGGGNKGQQAYVPSQTPDNLDSVQYAEVIDLLCEGEIEGFPSARQFTRGTEVYNIAALKDIYLDNTQILRDTANPAAPQSDDYNFQDIELYTRYGTQNQEYIPLAKVIQSEFAVGVKVIEATPVTRTITSPGADGIRITLSCPQLQAYAENGDIVGAAFAFGVDVSYNGGPFVRAVYDTFNGRTTDLYQREVRVNFTGELPAAVRVLRLSPDFNSTTAVGDLIWTSYTELKYTRLRYSNSALCGIKINAAQFGSIPSRAYRIRGLKIALPSNATVNSTTGALTYAGVWNGTFSQAKWTTDPAWCLWDLLTSKRYGTGNYITADSLDKFAFYSASQYCNQLVPDGFGQMEPRFSCNVNIQTADEAYNVINQMSSVFRAMPYWSIGTISISQDRPSDPVYLFNTSNVTEAGFSYSGSALKTRATVAVVKYFDINGIREFAYEVVEDQTAINKYGVIKTDIDAFACTSRGQARRLGEWLLYTAQNESEICSFATGIEAGTTVRPGQIIQVADPVRSGERVGGRIVEATLNTVTVDSVESISFAGGTPTLAVILPDGTAESRDVNSRNDATFTLSSPFSTTPSVGSIWIYQDSSIQTQLFRVLSVTEEDDINYSITALSYNPSKYDYIERDVPLTTRDISNLNAPPPAPTNLQATELLYENSGQVLSKIILSWQPVSVALSYRIRYRLGEGNWVIAESVSPDFEILNSGVGQYRFEIASLSASLKASSATLLTFNAVGKTAPPATIPDLFIASIDDKNAELYWPQAEDIDVRIGGQIRIRHCPLLGTSASWGESNDIVPAIPGNATRKIVPLLEGTYFIRAIDSLGNESAGTASTVVDLPAPQDAYIIQEYREEDNSPPFNGTKTSMEYSSGETALILSSDGSGGTLSSGSYQFSETLDLGAVYDVDIRNILKTRTYEPNDFWDSNLDDIDAWSDIDGGDLGQANCSLYIRTTNTNPSGSPTWSDWQPFVNNITRGRGFQFKLEVTCTNKNENVAVEELGVITQLQRRTETQRNLTSGTSSYTVTFPTAFYTIPSVGITPRSMAHTEDFALTSISRTGFTITFNHGGSTISKVFDYQAVGHGREII